MPYVATIASSLIAVAYVVLEAAPSGGSEWLISLVPMVAVTIWMQRGARVYHVSTVQDWGLFVLVLWPVILPWYVFKTRGSSGWSLLAQLFIVVLAPVGLANAVYIIKWGV